jgi:hypothetical protein
MICIGNQSCHNLNTHFPVVQTPFSEREREREIEREREGERVGKTEIRESSCVIVSISGTGALARFIFPPCPV